MDENDNPIPETTTSEHVNSFFTQIGLKLARNINKVYGPDLAQQCLLPVGYQVDYATFHWIHFSVEDVLKEIFKIQVHKSSVFS